MPTLVHIADIKDIASIRRNGIKISKWRTGIYCAPVTPNFFISHQWLRELKRSGIRTLCAVYFRLPSDEIVFAGRYNTLHREIPLSEAMKEFNDSDNKLGYELIIQRKIMPGEILSIKSLPQNIGWRFSPESKGQPVFCTCKYCTRSQIKANRLRKRLGENE
ncbi:MAG: hypothetical protein LBN39_12250 [Planctomycetaceae bacterium]|jgi:hypothetical protein|nr:hypothetical protein [Planctomycetaceae bacterium]